jgi:DUF2075 family protein
MIIYEESKSSFISDVDNNRIRDKLITAFKEKTGSIPKDSNVWAEEYTRFSNPLRLAKVEDEIRVALEYHIIAGGRFRLDVLLAGNNRKSDNALIVELKAWDTAGYSDYEGLVLAPYGGGMKPSQHPCLQASKYKGMIINFNEKINQEDIEILSTAYLFNLKRRKPEPLEDHRYKDIISDSRLFLADDAEQFTNYIEQTVPFKPRKNIMFCLENGKLKPTKALIEKVGSMLEGNPEFDLIDEQNVAFQIIRTEMARTSISKKRHVFIVRGGPGTGKSVIAVRLLADIIKNRACFIVAPNAAFRKAMIEYLSKSDSKYKNEAESLFRSSWNFNDIDYEKDLKHEILIIDEAHRLKSKAYRYYGKNMVEDMVRASRISVFFIDEEQRISWNDIGSEELIGKVAKKYAAVIHETFELTSQFRCNGSTGFLNWLDDVLQIKVTTNYDNWSIREYDFKVFDNPVQLYQSLIEKNKNNKARLIAGYSWEWPKAGRRRGTPEKHIQVDNLALPWNFDGENWATASDGIEQVGCIHTIQGLEFDYVGILIGNDLIYQNNSIIGVPENRAKTDKSLSGMKSELRAAKKDEDLIASIQNKAEGIIKSTYKVLMTRGRKGCYVWFADKALSEYFKKRLEIVSVSLIKEEVIIKFPQIIADPPSGKYVEFAPIYSLKAAAGLFGAVDPAECKGWVKVTGHKIDGRYFIAEVIGKSMEPLIKSGSFNLFRFGLIGTRNNKIVLAKHRSIADPETGGSYTVKKYISVKRIYSEQDWSHEQIKLLPLNPDFEPIEITPDNVEELSIIAEWICSIE